MKVGFILASLPLLLALSCPAKAQSTSGGKAIYSTTFYGENVYSYKITNSDVPNTPAWNPEQEAAPVSVRDALRIARSDLGRFVKEPQAWDLEDMELRQLDAGKWLYSIFLTCWNKKCVRDYGRDFHIFVKMDGSTVEPVVTPKDEESEP
jgi:hypothetical protein